MGQYPLLIGQGYWRTIGLRPGLQLTIGNLRMHDRLMMMGQYDLIQDGIIYHFHLSGEHDDGTFPMGAGEYGVYGSGVELKHPLDCLAEEPFLELVVWMEAGLFRSFVGDEAGQLPVALQPLIRPMEQGQYARLSKATPQMQTVARQILQCPYHGAAKRMYLEGKTLELMSMMVAAEMELNQPAQRPKPDLVERVHFARDILLQRLATPPSLAELARLSGLNEYSLKRGFRQVFGMTVFGYLHRHSMEQARQLLQTDTWMVEEVARMVGYSDLSAFGRAFRKQFGCCPRDCLAKKSV
ncbi:MAG: AraC family transcriptional regulator [Aphanocapsa sp. GSE-SYN-MK-11-07L]|jgi:AraC-like DNA-binding protein|nr:AraC family transcriptional regulator [Aphanocapsa sp. GSE-SYN-MK-11-07L]